MHSKEVILEVLRQLEESYRTKARFLEADYLHYRHRYMLEDALHLRETARKISDIMTEIYAESV